MSSNLTSITDSDGDHPDWIELYNNTHFSVSLGGYGLSDDPSNPYKWIFPNITIDPESFIVVFASDKDIQNPEEELHTNFRMSSSGESLIITSPEGIQVDLVNIHLLEVDQVYVRIPDGIGEWYVSDLSTPYYSNGNTPPLPKSPSPQFSVPSGQYSSGFQLELYSENNEGSIYYTLDGSLPDSESTDYIDPIEITETTVLRAINYQVGLSPSEITSCTYLIAIETELPVVSIITDPDNLWDWNTGIYVEGPNADPDPPHHGANYHNNWLIPAVIEMYLEDSQLSLASDCHIGIHGGYSRSFPRKSLKVISGTQLFNHQLFQNLPSFEFDSFLLRNSGNDWRKTLLHDAYLSQLSKGYGLLFQEYEPTVVYLNGEYWGIHNIRERITAEFIERHCGVEADEIDIVKLWYYADGGSNEDFSFFMNSLESLDLAIQEDFEYVTANIDIENFAKYQAFEIFIQNNDWPANNTRCWRDRNDGKFQWILYDTDISFSLSSLETNGLLRALEPDSENWVNNPRSTLLFRKLMENPYFCDLYVNSMCDLVNLMMRPERQQNLLNSLVDRIANEIPSHIQKWGNFGRPWDVSIANLLEFGKERRAYVIEHMTNYFGYNPPVDIRIRNNQPAEGHTWVNGYNLKSNDDFSGKYYTEVAIKIWAEPKSGFRFDGWTGSINSESDTLEFYPEENFAVSANFVEDVTTTPILVINEINYNNGDDCLSDDWIELVTTMDEINISGWQIKDNQDDNVFTIPANTFLERNEYLVVARDYDDFVAEFPYCDNVIGNLDFGLSSSGDDVKIYDNYGSLIDSASYLPSLPWPLQANGQGSTLQLKDIQLNNALPQNWIASIERNGSPGKFNQTNYESPFKGPISILPYEYGLTNAYPNPFNSIVNITYSLPLYSNFYISLYNINGQVVKEIEPLRCNINQVYQISINCDNLASGVYFVHGVTGNNLQYSRKIILLK